jgi:hypothetical protein
MEITRRIKDPETLPNNLFRRTEAKIKIKPDGTRIVTLSHKIDNTNTVIRMGESEAKYFAKRLLGNVDEEQPIKRPHGSTEVLIESKMNWLDDEQLPPYKNGDFLIDA